MFFGSVVPAVSKLYCPKCNSVNHINEDRFHWYKCWKCDNVYRGGFAQDAENWARVLYIHVFVYPNPYESEFCDTCLKRVSRGAIVCPYCCHDLYDDVVVDTN